MFRVSQQTDRIVGSLEAGEDFVDALVAICEKESIHAGDIRAVGHFDVIELVHFDSKEQRYKVLVDGEGSFDLVSLNGNVSRLGEEVVLRLDAVFNVMGPLGPQMVGGQLRKARVVGSEFVIEAFRDLRMERRLDATSGRLVLESIERSGAIKPTVAPAASNEAGEELAPTPSAPTKESTEPSMSWGEAIAEVEDKEKARAARRSGKPMPKRPEKTVDPYEDMDEDEPWPKPGDYLDHVKLGRCKVMKVEDEQYIHVRLPRGRIRKLALTVLDLHYFGEEDGRNIFEARVRR